LSSNNYVHKEAELSNKSSASLETMTGLMELCWNCFSKGKFKYDASRGLLKPSECRHMEEMGIWLNRHITFTVAEKSLIHRSICSIYGICGRGGSKITQKNVIYLNVP